mmetsp:Transcript_22916/g.38974  ORF Transcript_22916/g.38974 Transcript_22916/m.38974 type:complete len:197 (-) Transcript_22916:21-611(-)
MASSHRSRRQGTSSNVTAPPVLEASSSPARTSARSTRSATLKRVHSDDAVADFGTQQQQYPPNNTNHHSFPAPKRRSGGTGLGPGASTLSSYQTTPITKHYALNNQILAAFDSLYEKKIYKIRLRVVKVMSRTIDGAIFSGGSHWSIFGRRLGLASISVQSYNLCSFLFKASPQNEMSFSALKWKRSVHTKHLVQQ